MKAITIGLKGLETVMQTEIKELIGKDSTIENSTCIFEINDYKELCKLVYFGQSFNKAMVLLHSFSFKKIEDIIEKVIETDLLGEKKFRVKCKRIGEHDFNSQEIEEEISNKIDNKVDLKNPEIIIGVHILNDKCYIGIDFSGIDLSKRDYKLFPNPSGIKGPLGYSLVRLSEWKPGEVLLDPFCKDGTICIEACGFGKGISLNKFRKDKLQCFKMFDYEFEESSTPVKIYGYENQLSGVKASQKNSRIIGLNKDIEFSRIDVEWLDTKFNEGEIDKIVTFLPFISKRVNIKTIEKELGEFFHQAAFVLKPKGRAVCLMKDVELVSNLASKKNLKIVKTINIELGKEQFSIVVIEKS